LEALAAIAVSFEKNGLKCFGIAITGFEGPGGGGSAGTDIGLGDREKSNCPHTGENENARPLHTNSLADSSLKAPGATATERWSY